ncbi:hypothetical protein CERZMDRAFT_89936 [Cercospora zeae-maydis SCOH1-5]|uniref:Uncharacterized protein n=1 Tax=Cercospora zeae-maydis SCOH1-5 TaxID=717836 RepID=A0A6A6FTE9_9PEZI|nr:hypothetical protein CERZMDRAFT_89936 [Cercospora zeae-maydis SCOH1-5]
MQWQPLPSPLPSSESTHTGLNPSQCSHIQIPQLCLLTFSVEHAAASDQSCTEQLPWASHRTLMAMMRDISDVKSRSAI